MRQSGGELRPCLIPCSRADRSPAPDTRSFPETGAAYGQLKAAQATIFIVGRGRCPMTGQARCRHIAGSDGDVGPPARSLSQIAWLSSSFPTPSSPPVAPGKRRRAAWPKWIRRRVSGRSAGHLLSKVATYRAGWSSAAASAPPGAAANETVALRLDNQQR